MFHPLGRRTWEIFAGASYSRRGILADRGIEGNVVSRRGDIHGVLKRRGKGGKLAHIEMKGAEAFHSRGSTRTLTDWGVVNVE